MKRCEVGYRMPIHSSSRDIMFVEILRSLQRRNCYYCLISHDIIYAIWYNIAIIQLSLEQAPGFIEARKIVRNLTVISYSIIASNRRIGYTESNQPSRPDRWHITRNVAHSFFFLQITEEAAANVLAYGTKSLLEMPREHYRSITGK